MSIYGSVVKFATGVTLEKPWRVKEFYYPSEASYVTVPCNFDHGLFSIILNLNFSFFAY